MKFIGKEQKITKEYVDCKGKPCKIERHWAQQTCLVTTFYFLFFPIWSQKIIDSFRTKY